jgi:hypothetical protein
MSSTSSGGLVHALRQNWLGKTAIAVQSFLLAVAFVVVGLRVWTRRRQRVSLQGNDWFILAATVRCFFFSFQPMMDQTDDMQ